MQNNITDKKYHGLSEIAYTIKKGKIKENLNSSSRDFKILPVENNKNNGM